jgi:hypothetical protein
MIFRFVLLYKRTCSTVMRLQFVFSIVKGALVNSVVMLHEILITNVRVIQITAEQDHNFYFMLIAFLGFDCDTSFLARTSFKTPSSYFACISSSLMFSGRLNVRENDEKLNSLRV